MTKEEAKQKVAGLVAAYKALTPSQVKGYHEAKTKQGFVEPLFRYLGWDFDNVDEVAPEEKASKGRVDYAFKLRGVAQFYLEAKPLKADLSDPDYVQQAVTYAYNKGVTWAVLTDFEGLRVFNAQRDRPFLNLTCQDYLSDFDRLWLLSRESVESGALNREAAKVGALPPAQPVEKQLYTLLRQWREELYSQLHLHNRHLSFELIDEVIQRLFNRLFFIRTCEDQGIEERVLLAALNQWQASGRKGELIEALREIFRQFDGYYDSDLFMLHPLDQAFIEAPTVEGILSRLYEVPGGLARYDFSVIDADVLGAVYEQYLGYVATIVRQRAKEAQARLSLGLPAEAIALEAKKQKRKEQGIYYTPRWVTDYIVKQTVGRFIAERSHDEIVNIKVLDPACGSGSFLIRAYAELLDYHAGVKGKAATELDQWDRLPILTRNIFGVDLDRQAVEIARLNLLLRSLARRETLPSLAQNIRPGNSLISGGEKELKPCFGDAWRDKHPFNWAEEFPDIMKGGGFDVVIGNPPYVTEQLDEAERNYFRQRFRNSTVGKLNSYRLFIDMGVYLLKDGGLLGFIVPSTFLSNRDSTEVRRFVLENCKVLSVITLPEKAEPFQAVTQATAIVILQKSIAAPERLATRLKYAINITNAERLSMDKALPEIRQAIFGEMPDFMFCLPESPKALELAQKLDMIGQKLGNFAEVYQGEVNLTNYAAHISSKKVDESYQPLLRGNDIDRYNVSLASTKQKPSWVKADKVQRQHAHVDRIVTQEVSNMQQARRIKAGIAPKGCFCGHTTNYLLMKSSAISRFFILGLLNSKLLDFYFKLFNSTNHLPAREIERLPIRRIDFANPADKKRHDELVALVEAMLELNRKLSQVPEWEAEKRQEVEREIKRTDAKIDSLVYDLYGLTEEEREIVESQVS